MSIHKPFSLTPPALTLGTSGGENHASGLSDVLGQWSESAVRLAYHLTRDREAALDLSQEAFVRAFEALPELGDAASGKIWFTRIVVNLCRDWLRHRAAERRAMDGLQAVERVVRSSSDPSQESQRKEALERVRAAMLNLPLDYREALALVAVEGCAPKDAANVLGLPEGTLRWRLFEARKMLNEELERKS